MASRVWGQAWASFYELDNITSGTPVTYGGVSQFNAIVDNTARWRRVLSAIGSGQVTIYAVNNWEQFAVPGRVCIVHKNVSGYAGIVSRLITCFVIEDIEPGVRNGMNVVTLSGKGVEGLLTGRPVFRPIGQETIYETTLAATAAAPRATTLADPIEEGSDIAVVSDVTGIDKDDEIRIRLGAANDGDWHTAYVSQVNPPDTPAGTVQFTPALPAAAGDGNSVETRTAGLSLASVANLAVGQRVEITLDNATIFTTTIRRIDSPLSAIFLETGLTSIATSGNAVEAFDYSRPATDDVTQIMQYAPGWNMTFEVGNGTAIGTAHDPADDSVFDLLRTTAERTGEMFRYRVLAAGLPTYRLDWRQTPDDSGVRLIMYAADEHDRQLADEDDIGKASILTLKSRRSRRLITRVYPKAGDGAVSLRYCTPAAVTNAVVDGFTIHVSDDFYEGDYVELTSDAAEFGIHAIQERYPDISVIVGNPTGLTAAADQLLASAMQTLYQASSQFEYTIEAFVPSLIHPGQYVKIENETGTVPDDDGINTYTVLETTEALVDGRPRTTLVVANHTNYRRTPAQAVATLVRSLQQTQRRVSGRLGGGSGGTTIVSGGGGGGGDHGALTGLTDDDHPQYLLTNGSRTLTGNLAVAPGVTIDGVDLSALPGGHNPVTAGNAGLLVEAGQVVSLKLSALPAGLAIRDAAPNQGLTIYLNAAGSGLELTASGLSIADALAGDGLKMTSKVMHVDIPVSGGLTIIGGQLSMGTPGQLSVNSVGVLTGSSHTHAILASSNPGTTTQLLKTDASGYLQLLAMGIGTAPDGASALKIVPPGAAWSGLLLKQRSDQNAPLLRIENAAGGALLIVTNSGDLESGNPGFVSGLRGWQISAAGDVEFNNGRFRGEFHAATFVADEMHALGGTLLAASATTVADPSGSYNNVMKAIDVTATTYLVVNASWATGLCYFAAKDVVRVKSLGVPAGGGMYIPDIYLEVSSVIALNDRDLANGNPGRHVLACVRKSGAYTNYVVPTGAAVVKWTRTGQGAGAYKGQLLITSDLAQSPYIDIFTVDASLASLSPWPGSGDIRTPPTIKPRVRLGNLDGVLGLAEQWGIAAGTDLSDTTATAPHLIASNLGVTLKNVDLSMYSGVDRIVQISPAGITLLNGTTQFVNDRSIRWNKSNGVTVGALSVRESAGVRYLELGLSPSFGFDTMAENGIRVVHNTAAAYGANTHDFNIWGHGRIQIVAGAEVAIGSTFTRTGSLRLFNGVTVGDGNTDAPTAAVRLKTRAALGSPPVGFADFYLTTNASGIDELYIRFAGRSPIKLA